MAEIKDQAGIGIQAEDGGILLDETGIGDPKISVRSKRRYRWLRLPVGAREVMQREMKMTQPLPTRTFRNRVKIKKVK